MSYRTGQLLWGSSKAIGNVWIVTNGLTNDISLVYNGKLKSFMLDGKTTKRDVIAATSFLYELTPAELTALGTLPTWAAFFYAHYNVHKAPYIAPLAPAVVRKVERMLNVNLTPRLRDDSINKAEDGKCPVSGASHTFIPYTGLNETFEYCKYCDSKRKP